MRSMFTATARPANYTTLGSREIMKTAIVYYSQHHGNTKKLIDAIAEKNDHEVNKYYKYIIGFYTQLLNNPCNELDNVPFAE